MPLNILTVEPKLRAVQWDGANTDAVMEATCGSVFGHYEGYMLVQFAKEQSGNLIQVNLNDWIVFAAASWCIYDVVSDGSLATSYVTVP